MIEKALRAHASRDALHMNGNLVLAGAAAALVASWVAASAGARLSSPEAITGASTASAMLAFVPIHFLLHYLHTASLPDTAPVGLRYWQGVELVYLRGAMGIALFLGLSAAVQDALIHAGMLPEHACLAAHAAGQMTSRAVPLLLLRRTAPGRRTEALHILVPGVARVADQP